MYSVPPVNSRLTSLFPAYISSTFPGIVNPAYQVIAIPCFRNNSLFHYFNHWPSPFINLVLMRYDLVYSFAFIFMLTLFSTDWRLYCNNVKYNQEFSFKVLAFTVPLWIRTVYRGASSTDPLALLLLCFHALSSENLPRYPGILGDTPFIVELSCLPCNSAGPATTSCTPQTKVKPFIEMPALLHKSSFLQ
jgi:hypothetical protein